ncbi:MAG: alpha/beta hydrolase [Atopobiaceae bacterium]|nr:alpha/beta hydrolase [Atopobiaceae bacterium]
MTYQPRTPQPYQGNPFGFVYGGALTANVEDAVHVHPISYDASGVTVAANVYTPAGYSEVGSYAGIVVGHPNGAVKEQAAGLYAQHLAAEGFVTIAFDAVTTGESGGEPRNRDIPYLRVEDYRLAADILSTFPGVDASRLAVLGICGGGGYALSAAQMDKRFKAVAVVSMFNTGSVRREGFQKVQADSVLKRLHDVADLRAREAQSGELVYSADMSAMDPEVGHNLPFDMYREGYEYYVETHAHPHSHSRFAQRDLMDLFAWDPDDFMYLIDQPLLMVVGEKADTAYMSESAFAAATGTEDKELHVVADATHVDLYWKPDATADALAKLAAFYQARI